ncbi:MAG: hypothetical protein FD130_1303, partial [Halothiobacillaceae bacterium]
GLLFGVAVTKRMYEELQLDQGLGSDAPGAQSLANMPSLPSAFVRAAFQGKITNWSDEAIYGQFLTGSAGVSGGVDASETVDGTLTEYDFAPAQVHLCRRVQGSGTHAQFMIHNMRTNCQAGTYAMPPFPGGGAFPVVIENSSSGTIGLCMDELDRGTAVPSSKAVEMFPDLKGGHVAYAMAYQSLEKNMNLAENYRFVKIDGVAPTLQNAFSGDYHDIYYTNMQWNTASAGYTADAGKVLTAMSSLSPAALAEINTGFVFPFGQGGFLQPSAAAPAAFDLNNPLTPWGRVAPAGDPDSCQPLTRL